MRTTDTIAGIATAVSKGGISIIRVSGSEAILIVDRLFTSVRGIPLSAVRSHTIHYGMIKQNGNPVDEVMVSVMRAPRTYTREDVVEINCHGGIRVTVKILEAVLAAGARAAQPGEFTKRAFLNGRIDLSQAEAVMDMIHSQNDYALQASVRQLKGNMREELNNIRNQVLQDVAFIEAALDDPEHIQVEERVDEIKEHVDNCLEKVKHLLINSETGRIIKEGIRTVILGKPNAGKSSFLNKLAGEDLAIVTDVPGTTRDALEQALFIGGLPLNVIDTAGIRETDDVVEQIGVKKAMEKAKNADLILYMVDSSIPLDANDQTILKFIQDRTAMILLNKTDLSPVVTKEKMEKLTDCPIYEISAKEGSGIEKLERALQQMFALGNLNWNEEIYITNARQRDALQVAQESFFHAKDSLDAGMPEDFLTIDLMAAYETLGEITGDTTSEDLVNRIFQDFCVGK